MCHLIPRCYSMYYTFFQFYCMVLLTLPNVCNFIDLYAIAYCLFFGFFFFCLPKILLLVSDWCKKKFLEASEVIRRRPLKFNFHFLQSILRKPHYVLCSHSHSKNYFRFKCFTYLRFLRRPSWLMSRIFEQCQIESILRTGPVLKPT